MSDIKPSPGVTCCLRENRNSLEENVFTWDHPDQASVGAIFMAALSGGEIAHGHLASSALDRLADELAVYERASSDHETEGPLNPEILARVLHGIQQRARAAAEVSRRFDAAPPLPVAKARNGSTES